MSKHTRRDFLLSLMVPFAISATACNRTSPAQQAADQFMDAYYVQINLPGALVYTEGLAKEKIEGQMNLLQGQSEGGPGPAQNKPQVNVSLIDQQHPSEKDAVYIYRVDVNVADVGKRTVFVKLHKESDHWLVSQFTEDDGS